MSSPSSAEKGSAGSGSNNSSSTTNQVDPRELPLVSIVICCFNRADYIARTVESALQQSYTNTEVLVFDDGSTDATGDVIASFGDRVRYHRQDNTGIAIARTRALERANGTYIAFLDDDDLMPPDRVQHLLEVYQRHPQAAFVVGDLELIDARDEPIPGSRSCYARTEMVFSDGYAAVLWPRVPATVHTTLFLRAKAEQVGFFDASFYQAGEDKDFFARLAQTGPVVYTPEVVSLYRTGHTSLSRDTSKIARAQLRLVCRALEDGLITDQATITRLRERVAIALLRLLESESQDPQTNAETNNQMPAFSLWLPSRYLGWKQLTTVWMGRLKQKLKRLMKRD